MEKNYEQSKKGLQNPKGNMCWLNTILQQLYRSNTLIDRLDHEYQLEETRCGTKKKVLLPLKNIMDSMRNSSNNQCPSGGEVREALCNWNAPFQHNAWNDAGESFMVILNVICKLTCDVKDKALPCNCMAHSVFGMDFDQIGTCSSCQNVIRCYKANEFVLYAFAEQMLERPDESFEALVQKSLVPYAGRPKCCGKKCSTGYYLKSSPDWYTLKITWKGRISTKFDDVMRVTKLIPSTVDMEGIFLIGKPQTGNLKGMVCSLGGYHYVAFFLKEDGSWEICNDKMVQNIGNWNEVMELCFVKKYRPDLLFYQGKLYLFSSVV